MYKKSESGQAAVTIALALVVMVAFVALAIDAGNAYTARREAQNAADAAAMAAARQLVLECRYGGEGAVAGRIRDKAEELIAANNVDTKTVKDGKTVDTYEVYYSLNSGDGFTRSSYQVKEGSPVPCGCGVNKAAGIEVIASNPTQSFLAGIVGVEALGSKAGGKARYAPAAVNSGNGLYPVTRNMVGTPLNVGEAVEIRDLNNNTAPGNFGWLTWAGSPSAPVLKVSMTPPGDSNTYINPNDPNDHTVSIGDWVQGAPGNMANLKKTLDDYWVNTGEIMVFPLYDQVGEGNGNNATFRVGGFAAVEITGYELGGNDKHIDARIVQMPVSSDWINVPCESTTVYSVKLVP